MFKTNIHPSRKIEAPREIEVSLTSEQMDLSFSEEDMARMQKVMELKGLKSLKELFLASLAHFEKATLETEPVHTTVTLKCNEVRVIELNRLMELCEIETRVDLFNNALSFYEKAAWDRANGRVIKSVAEEAVLSSPTLDAAARNGHKFFK